MSLNDLYKAEQSEIARALSRLDALLDQLTSALGHRDFYVSVQGAHDTRLARRRICDAYRSIDYGIDDVAGCTNTCLGVAGVSADILKTAEQVNEAKLELRVVCARLQDKRVRLPKRISNELETVPLVRFLLRRLQRSDLNLLAAYRRIPVLTAVPRLITFTRATTRAVYRKPVSDIGRMLEAYSNLRAADDIDRLLSLDPTVTHLALVKDHYENVRANVAYQGLDRRARGRVQLSAEIPIIFLRSQDGSTPQIKYPPDKTSGGRNRTRAAKLERQPFLHCLPVFKYLTK